MAKFYTLFGALSDLVLKAAAEEAEAEEDTDNTEDSGDEGDTGDTGDTGDEGSGDEEDEGDESGDTGDDDEGGDSGDEGGDDEDTTEVTVGDETYTFSTTFESEETTAVVAALEEEIASEDGESTVFTEEVLTATTEDENVEYGEYLGTYDVSSTVEIGEGETATVMVCPTPVTDEYAEGVVVMHYDEETGEWNQETDVTVDDDGYVWATVSSLSPFATYTIRRTIYEITWEKNNTRYIVCQGLPVTIEDGDSDSEHVITDVYGRSYTFDCSTDSTLVGGYLDRTDYIKQIDIVMNGGNFKNVLYGSVNTTGTVEEIGTINFTMNGGTIYNLTGAGIGYLKIGTVNAVFNTDATNPSAGPRSYDKTLLGGDINDMTTDPSELGSYIENANLTINSGSMTGASVYMTGSSGYTYTKNATLNFNGGTAEYASPASNGRVENAVFNINGGYIGNVAGGNRGAITNVTYNMTGGEITLLELGSYEDEGEAVIGSINATISGGTVGMLQQGKSNTVTITASDGIIQSLVYADGTVSEFADGFETEFADVITKN